MNTKARLGFAAAATAVLVAAPTTAAQAADFTMWSTSGQSYVWHNDAGNTIVVCDMVSGDGVGARAMVIGNRPYRERTVYNGCETFHHITDGWWQDVTVCDWVHRHGERMNANCRHTQFKA